jgi:hypothetical protein
MQTHDLGAFSKRKIFASHHAFNEPSTLLFREYYFHNLDE